MHGTITVTGPPTDSLVRLWVEVVENGVVRATGELARVGVSQVRDTLLNRQFGTAGVSVLEGAGGTTPALFEIPANQLANLNQTLQDEQINLRLQVRAQFASGVQILPFVYEMRFGRVVQYTQTNPQRRFGTRDLADCEGLSPAAAMLRNRPTFPCGGDSWLNPRMKIWADRVTVVTGSGGDVNVRWNDFSNMHAGFFPIDADHRDGNQADGIFAGYVNMDAAAAEKMIDFLRRYGREVTRVFVGYNTVEVNGRPCARAVPVADTDNSNPFWNVIRASAALPNGVIPRNVIRNASGHCDHFDVRINPSLVQ